MYETNEARKVIMLYYVLWTSLLIFGQPNTNTLPLHHELLQT